LQIATENKNINMITRKYLLGPACNTWSRDGNFDCMEDCRRLRHVLDRLNPLYVGSGRVAGSRPIENRADSNSTNFRPSSRAKRGVRVRVCVCVCVGRAMCVVSSD